jgi:hypothetical protein
LFFQATASSADKEMPLVRLRFDAPVFFFAGDRLIIRDSSERATIAGAIVLDPNATHTHFRRNPQREFLKTRAQAPDDVAVFVATQLRRDHAAVRSSLLLQSRFSETEIAAAVNLLTNESKTVQAGEILLDGDWWSELRARAIKFIGAEHAAHPEQLGITQSRLQSELKGSMPLPEIFETLLADLCHSGFSRTSEVIHRADRRPALAEKLQTAAARIRSALPRRARSRFDLATSAAFSPRVRRSH